MPSSYNFYLTSEDITPDDITKAEKLLSVDGNIIKFDKDSEKVIRYMDSCFIQACPGSGKSTTLVAKLAILADKLPQNYQGICVLSHTNVAKDVIRERLGNKADRLLKYPNFIGTIQAFVDRYLAIPAMIEKFGIRLIGIDDDIFSKRLEYSLFDWQLTFLKSKKINFTTINYIFNDLNQLSINKNIFNSTSDKEQRHYKNLVLFSKRVKEKGYITYDDAFALANWYIEQHPDICNLISQRFPYVYIDEVQDTSEDQLSILTSIFKNSSIQYFGDNNQNLYDPKLDILEKIKTCDNNINENNVLKIANSYRLSPNICNLAQHVCKNKFKVLSAGKQYICGNKKTEDCKKCDKCQNTIILYDDSTIKEVLPIFARLIYDQKQKKQDMGNCFKLIGHIGKEKEEITLADYHDKYKKINKITGIKNSQLENFYTVLLFAQNYINQNNFKEARKLLIRGLIKLFNFLNIDNVTTKTDLIDYFKEKQKLEHLNEFLFLCCHSIKEINFDYTKIQKEVFNLLKEIKFSVNADIYDYICSEASNDNTDQILVSVENKYKYHINDIEIEIEINTIAGEKGETHDATLLVETFNYGEDLKYFLMLIANKTKAKKYLEHSKLSNIYVAMTRPKHLLCLAMHKDSYDKKYTNDLKKLGWRIDNTLLKEIEEEKEDIKEIDEIETSKQIPLFNVEEI